jgi:hypothetical protein
MARKIRIEYADAVCHMIVRGNQGRAVIADDLDRTMRLGPLGEACAKTGWPMNACVLTGNHNHRLVETPDVTFVAGTWMEEESAMTRTVRWAKSTHHARLKRLKEQLLEGVME